MLNAVCLANLPARRASISVNILFLSSEERAAGALGPRRALIQLLVSNRTHLRLGMQ